MMQTSSQLLLKSAKQHFLRAHARESTIYRKPFYHARLENLWPEEFNELMLDSIPPNRKFEVFKFPEESYTENGWTRKRIVLNKKGFKGIKEPCRSLWVGLVDFFNSPEYISAVLDLVGLGMRDGQLPRNRFKPKLVVQLLKDFPGYQIKPHPDSESKVMTAQYYLTRVPVENAGTIMYRRRVDAREGNVFTPFRTMEFTPRSGYVFARKECSWHGVERLTDEAPRHSIIVRFYI